jgi:carboxyl-terminal processing protease
LARSSQLLLAGQSGARHSFEELGDLGDSTVKRTFSIALTAFFALTLTLPSFVYAQQRPQPQAPIGKTSSTKPTTLSTGPARRVTRTTSSPIPPIEKDFDEALKVIHENYIDKDLDYNAVFKSSIIGMLRSLDPHSNYYDRDEYEELKTDQRSQYFGIGASIQNYVLGKDSDTFITSTFDGSPAARAGLRFGDRIVAVDSTSMTGKTSLEVRDKIRGPRGSVVKLTLERASTKRIELVELTRDAVAQPSIPDAYIIKPGVGYIDMTRGFNYTTTDELEEALSMLRSKGANSLVLDLRNNPGGFLDQAIRVAEEFLPSGQLILTQKGRAPHRDTVYSSQNKAANPTPLVVLINEYSASASEIVAGAMQDHDRALIVGHTSFGKGLVQSIIPLDYGAGLTLTSAKYYTPSGRLIQRDYSEGGFYDYYTHGGSRALEQKETQSKPTGSESKTDAGRAVYGGGGIAPDEPVERRALTNIQLRLRNPMFFFARELANERIPNRSSFRVDSPGVGSDGSQASRFSLSPSLYSAFKSFVAAEPSWVALSGDIDRNREFVEVELGYFLITAAQGITRGVQFLIQNDPQVARAIEAVPRARKLAMSGNKYPGQP